MILGLSLPRQPGCSRSSIWQTVACVYLLAASITAFAGGPRYVAGVSYFNPGVKGQAVHWAGGQVRYFVDQGPLNASVSNQQATAMVDAAAAIWSAVPTAAVKLTDAGNLAEDVNGSNVLAGGTFTQPYFSQPSDISPSATTTPVAVIFDADGSAIDALEGVGASQPDNCSQNGVLYWLDAMNPDATFAHGVIVLNGRCATNANLIAMMQFQLERAFGRILGLDFSQVNDGALSPGSAQPNGALAWPVMLPLLGQCGPAGGTCIPNPGTLRLDDIAALNRIYPVTAANQSGFPGKLLTAAHTISVTGTLSFRTGQGMQGVNVVLRPLDGAGNPMYQYTVSTVSGAYFAGNHGNPVTGWTDSLGNRLDRFGSDDGGLQGYFDLSDVPLPPGITSASYQLSFEPVNPLYINATSVGPYILGSPKPSGTLQTIRINTLQAGSAQSLSLSVSNSASAAKGAASGANKTGQPNATGSEPQPLPLPRSGGWTGRLSQVGQADWFILPVRGNRIFTVVAQALDETGKPSAAKALPALGVWDGFTQTGTAAAGFTPAQNGLATGETWLQVATAGNDVVRLAITDQRGDGRPDYLYRGWVLYADSVSPTRLPASGGTIVIRGFGFRAGDTVMVGGMPAQVTSIQPNQITAVVSAAGAGVSGSQDVEVDDMPSFSAVTVIPSGLSYDSASGDALNLLTAPSNQVPVNVPKPFSVRALGPDGSPAAGVTVLYSVTSGAATLGCGLTVCSAIASGDGRATMPVTATSTAAAVVTASLTNGAGIQAHFYGGAAPALSAITPTLYLAAGATVNWPVQALVLSAGAPAANQHVSWTSVTGISAPATASTTNSSGIGSATLVAGPLTGGQTATSNACLNNSATCVPFNVFGARSEFASLAAVSGTRQSVAAAASPAAVILRALDMNGNPMAGATVTVSQTLYAWAPPCAAHGRCPQPQVLSSKSSTVTSALDGTVTITPLTLPGTPTRLVGLAVTGNAGTLSFTVEQHP